MEKTNEKLKNEIEKLNKKIFNAKYTDKFTVNNNVNNYRYKNYQKANTIYNEYYGFNNITEQGSLMSSDSNFEKNYNNKEFSIDNGKINGVSASSWVSQASMVMNGKGFKFGSKITAQDLSVKRTAKWCVAFDHKSKGFDNNNSQKCIGYFTNCVSFNNNINYQLPYIFDKWENNWSWGAKSKEKYSMNQTIKKPSNTNSAQKSFYSIRDNIIKAVYANKFPDEINFDDAIKNLS
jgi:hypothetical protein